MRRSTLRPLARSPVMATVLVAEIVSMRRSSAVAVRSRRLPEAGAEKAAALASLARQPRVHQTWTKRSTAADAALAIAEPFEEWRTIVDAFTTLAVDSSSAGAGSRNRSR